jgi:DNA-directed RNA polymerase subunit E'/Rpb7
MLLFKSFKDEILEGTVLKNTPKGLLVSLKFVDVFIPGELLNKGSYFDTEKKIWIWSYEQFKALYYENQTIRFKTNTVILEKIHTPNEFFIIGQCN